MRRLTPLALLLVLLTASPALATLGDEFGSEQQTEGYGRMFAYVLGAAAAIVILLTLKHVIKSTIDESRRGRKVFVETDILDENPENRREPDPVPRREVPSGRSSSGSRPGPLSKYLAESDDAFSRKKLGAVASRRSDGQDRHRGPVGRDLEDVVGPKAMEAERGHQELKSKGDSGSSSGPWT